ncbi:hypothetical protein CMV_017068 [Castanea mollissima]|uniref:Uncharacterized protein n=1 Tax=Castanea mollissima TaxID=60419 RepID=A0A8J4QTJ9_9ROSI|nr:hypothetical protein CMV_017068 [Castanea mollissima]
MQPLQPRNGVPHLPWVSSSPWPINYVGIKPVETGPKVYSYCLSLHSFPPFESGVKVETERGGVISLLSSHNIPDNLSEIGVEYVEVGI